MEEQPILVLGATGTTGRRVAGRLRAAGTRSGPHALSFIEASRSSAGHRADRPLPGTAEDYLAAQTALGAPAEQTQPEIEAFLPFGNSVMRGPPASSDR
jgi:hypothetical protein